MSEEPTYEELKKRVLELEQVESKSKRSEAALWVSEEKYRTILESIDEAYFEVDLKGNFTFFNDSLSIILGYSRDELMGKNNRDYMPPRSSKEILNLFGQIYKTGKPVRKHAYEVIKKDGTKGFHELAASLMQDKDGNPIGFRGIAHDVTARKRAEDALQQAHDELEHRVAMRTEELALVNEKLRLDITERKQATKALRENENLLRAIVEGTQALLANVDVNGYFTYANDATARAVGYAKSEELIGKSYLDFIHPEDRQQVRDTFINQVNTRQPSIMQEFRITDTEGNVKWFSFLSTLTIKDGQFVGQSGVAQDITEHKQAEEALLQEYGFRNAIIDHVAEGLCVCHETKEYPFVKFTIWNERMAEITGYTLEEINRLGWYQTVYPDPELRAKATERMQRMWQRDDLRDEEWEITRADGNKRVLIISSSVVKSDDGLIHVMALMQDISERKRVQDALKESEARYRLLADNAMDVIWTVDFDNRMTYVSPSIKRLFGFTAEEAMARTMQQAFTPTSFENAILIFAEEMAIESTGHGDPSRSRMIELEMFHKNGNTIPIEGHFSFLRDPTGKAIGILSIVREITERKNAEIERENLISDLRKALQDIKRLSGLLPICSFCKKIRDDKGYWTQIESYIHEHSEAEFSHSICLECAKKNYPDLNL